jgi:2'-5' RNA ligase
VRTTLPAGLERLRRDRIADAADGVPAHLTLLYPFVQPERLDGDVRARLGGVARDHPRFEYRLREAALWPDTVYVRVEPEAPFVHLQRALQAAFPEFPIYGPDWNLEFVPHVSIAEGHASGLASATADPAWGALPEVRQATRIDVIARGANGRWRTLWRIPLGRPSRSARG